MGYVDTLQAVGLTVTVNDRGNLWVAPAALLTDELRSMLKDQKWVILAELAGKTPATLAVAENTEQIAGQPCADHDRVAPWEDAPPALPDVINLTEWCGGAHPGVQIGEFVGATGKPWIGGKVYAVFSRATA